MSSIATTRRTAAEKQKKALARSVEKQKRAQARARVKSLRAKLKETRIAMRDEIKSSIAQCREDRAKLRQKIKDRARELREALKRTNAQERYEARELCKARKARIRGEALSFAERTRAELAEAKRSRAELAAIDERARAERASLARHRTTTYKERRDESDSIARGNLDPGLWNLWEKEKRNFSYELEPDRRAEQFLEWVEAHPSRLYEEAESRMQREIAELERQQREAERAARPAAIRKAALEELERQRRGSAEERTRALPGISEYSGGFALIPTEAPDVRALPRPVPMAKSEKLPF